MGQATTARSRFRYPADPVTHRLAERSDDPATDLRAHDRHQHDLASDNALDSDYDGSLGDDGAPEPDLEDLMPAITAPAAAAPDEGRDSYQALLDHIGTAIARIRHRLGLARAASPATRAEALTRLADELRTAEIQLRRQLDGWPPPPAVDEAP
jgi:hypothetical protein